MPYAKENVPFKPKHWLKVSPEGAGPGDLVFVAGYPGKTLRFATYAETKELVEWAFPRTVRRYADLIAILDEVGKKSKETELRVATRKRGLNNTLTNRKGVVDGFKKGNLLGKKEGMEKELAAWIAAEAKRQRDYGDVLPALNGLQAGKEKTRERDATLGDLLGVAPGAPMLSVNSLLGSASLAYRLSLEKPKKDLEREPEYQERNWGRIREALDRLQRNYRSEGGPGAPALRARGGGEAPGRPANRDAGQAPRTFGRNADASARPSTPTSTGSTPARSWARRRPASRSSTSPRPTSSPRRTRSCFWRRSSSRFSRPSGPG